MNLQKYRKIAGLILTFLFLIFIISPQVKNVIYLPDNHRMVVGEASLFKLSFPKMLDEKLELSLSNASKSVFTDEDKIPIQIKKNIDGYEIIALNPGKTELSLKLWGAIPIKKMEVESIAKRRLIPGGHSIGVLLQSKGIMVVGFASIQLNEDDKSYPAKDAGIEIGDLILKINGEKINNENELAQIIDEKTDNTLNIEIKRADKYYNVAVKTKYCSETQRNRIGLYIRDGVSGVGTLSFWDPVSKEYAALGHIIMDSDTRQGIEVENGVILSALVKNIRPGRPGRPGEKIGVFNQDGKIKGNIIKNSFYGIYGSTENEVVNPLEKYTMEVAYAHQVKIGKAEIFTVVHGDTIERFEVQIENLYPDRENGKGMVIKVTDPRLLSISGGIIQGMSGSPIIQDEKLIGAVTHVFLNDPTRGYGIFMDYMLGELSN